VIQVSVASVVMLMIGQLAGAFVQTFLHRPPEDMSLILAPAAIGLVGASVVMPRLAQRVGKLRLTMIGLLALGAGFILLPISHWFVLTFDKVRGTESPLFLWLIVFLVFVLGVAMSSINIPAQTILQERAPETSRARVLSLQFMLYNAGSIPVLLFAGVIAQIINLSALMFIMAAAILLFYWWGIRYVRQGEEEHGDVTLGPSH
jgi:MFS family permease